MITRFVQFCFCLSLILTQSCKDDESTGKLVLDETIYDEDNGLFDKYFYDDKGVSTRAEYYSDDKLASYSVYAYADGRHVSRDYYMIGVGGDPQLYSTTTFQYDLDDNLSEVLTQSVSREIVYKTTWSNEQITKVERTQNNVSTFVEYKYDGKNNVSVITAYSDDGSLDYVLELLYDDHSNPLYALNGPLDIVTSNILNMSPNNVTLIEQRKVIGGEVQATTDITYTYTDTGMPKEGITRFTHGLGTTESVTKFYYKII